MNKFLAVALISFINPAIAQIYQLPDATLPLSGSEYTIIDQVQGGSYNSVKTQVSNLASPITSNLMTKTASNATLPAARTGLGASVSGGIWPVSLGGTGGGSASGTLLDNITGFADTGFLVRTGSGTYSFQSATNGITLANIAKVGPNTLIGNTTGGLANLTAITVGSCSTSGSALIWTTNTGPGCNTAIDAATLGTKTFASPAAIGTGTPAAGTFTALAATSVLTNRNVTALPAAFTLVNYPVQTQCADTQGCNIPVVAYAANSAFVAFRINGTAATPLHLNLGDQIGAFGSGGYKVNGLAGGTGGTAIWALEDWNDTSTPTYLSFDTLAHNEVGNAIHRMHVKSGVTINDAAGVEPTGGDKGAGTLNVIGAIYDNGTAPTGTAGSGYARATSPTFVTPTLGVATATSINKVAITAPAASATLTIADGKTLTSNASLTLSGTDGTTMTFPSTNGTVVTLDATQSLSNKTLSDPIYPAFTVSTAQLDKTNDTTLASITGLSVALTAGKTYSCSGRLTTTSGAGGGVKVALSATGGLTATSLSVSYQFPGGNTFTQTTLGTAVGATAAITDIFFDGAIVVNAGGTIVLQAAQNAVDAATTSIFINSTLRCVRTN